ncbi:MAG: hypothetical protein WCV80_03090 [Candidatus Paceibacterota bacterium]|jgi:hypothetical protein
MKKLRIPLKVAVILFFVWNTGIFEKFARVASEESKFRNDPVANAKVVALCEERYQIAIAKVERGEVYSPYDYFRDLGDVYAMEDSFQVNVGYYARHGMNDLQALSMRFLNNKQCSYDDVEKARETFKGHKYDRIRNEAKNTAWATVWSEALRPWLVSQYLKGLPLACILLLLWIGEGNERKKRFFLRSPISFLFSLVCYPLIFVIVFIQWVRSAGRSVYAEVELRRTKDAFLAVLSHDELDAIKRFAESRFTWSSWRERLQSRGFVARRSFALGFISFVVCFVVLGPHQAFAKENGTNGTRERHVVIVAGGSSGGIECVACHTDIVPDDHDALRYQTIIFELQSIFRSYVEYASTLCEGWLKDIQHIPVSWLTRCNAVFTMLTIYQKETGNESILFHITHGAFLRYHICTATR